MGRTLNRAPLPRDASGQVDLAAVSRALSALAVGVEARPARRGPPGVLVESLVALGGAAPLPPATNGHSISSAPRPEGERREPRSTAFPAAPAEAPKARAPQPTDVRGVGRVLPAPVSAEDVEGTLSMRAPSVPAPSDTPVVVASNEETVVMVPDDVDLASLPPLDGPPSPVPVPPSPIPAAPPAAPSNFPLPSSRPAPLSVVPPAAPPSIGSQPPAPSMPPAAPPAFASTPPRRPTQASIPIVASVRPPPVASAEVAASFDELLGSTPVEPLPRAAPPPLSIPRAPSTVPGLPRRPTMQIPALRVPSATGLSSGAVPRIPTAAPKPPVVEPVEALEMDEVEVEEIAAGPEPVLSRPPALPPIPPKRR